MSFFCFSLISAVWCQNNRSVETNVLVRDDHVGLPVTHADSFSSSETLTSAFSNLHRHPDCHPDPTAFPVLDKVLGTLFSSENSLFIQFWKKIHISELV